MKDSQLSQFIDHCLECFRRRGAVGMDVDILVPAAALLDLYGEDIRSRTYVTDDPEHGELMLRPDFTVPIIRQHLRRDSACARICYSGPVFRRPRKGSGRRREYLQVGLEDFGHPNPLAADADMLALFCDTLAGLELDCAIGDMGVLIGAIASLDTSEYRKSELLRHLWRPHRFRRLLDRFTRDRSGFKAPSSTTASRSDGSIGLRGQDEIDERLAARRDDAMEPPIPESQSRALREILAYRGTAMNAVKQLRAHQDALSGFSATIDRLAYRMARISDLGIDLADLSFEASFGRTTLEYYDGFVFGFFLPNRPEEPPLATGGRYDHLTQAIGGRSLSAVGGVIRPEFIDHWPGVWG